MSTLTMGDTGDKVNDAKAQIRRLQSQSVPLYGRNFDFQMAMAVMAMQADLNRPQTGVLNDQLLADYEQYLRDTHNFVPPGDAGDIADSKNIEEARQNIWKRAKMELDLYR